MDLALTIVEKKIHHILGFVLSLGLPSLRVCSCAFSFDSRGKEDSSYTWSCLEYLGFTHVDLVLTIVEKKTHHILGLVLS